MGGFKIRKLLIMVGRYPIQYTKSIDSVLTSIKAGPNIFMNQKFLNIQFLGQISPTNVYREPPVGGFKDRKLFIMVGRYPM